ncbi:MAG: hypothetical protein ACRDKZ_13375 [Actinomycetota bacterium]
MDTFLVRVWAPVDADCPEKASMRGEVRHIRSGTATAFVGEGELLEFIAEMSRRPANPDRRPPNHSSHRRSNRKSGPLSLQEWLSFGSDPDA